MKEALKPIEWLGDSLGRVRQFSRPVRQLVGFELEMVQHGADPTDWKPIAAVGPGVREIRVHLEGEYRIFYVAKFKSAIYVLHVVVKKTRKTPGAAIELARERYRQALRMERLEP